jgi:predicted esterase
MTKEARLDEIKDYSAYLSRLYDTYVSHCPHAKIVLLGFSQGVATQLRWMLRDFPAFDYLVLYAGTLPEDLDYKAYLDYLQRGQLHLLYGTEDEFISADVLSRMQTLLEEHALPVTLHTFPGTHQVDRKVLQDLFRQNLLSASDRL